MIREIRYSVSKDGISPAGRQFGGVQGEHKRTRIWFDLPEEIFDEVKALQENGGNGYYRFEIYNGAGEVFRTASERLTTGDRPDICYTLEERDTRYGGIVHVVLSITGMNAEGTEWEMYTFPAELKFKNKPDGVASDGKNRISYSELERKALEASDAALKVKQAYDNGELKGDKGDTGPQGPRGPKGEDGKDAGGDNILHFLTYEIIDGEVHITYCNSDISGNRIIPKFIDGYPVVSIDGFNHNGLTSIVIPDSVRSIGEDAFIDDGSLTSVYIPDSVTSIERGAFDYTSITDVYYGGSEEQWAAISVEDSNDRLYIANIHYNQKPATIADVIKHAENQGYILTDADKQEIASLVPIPTGIVKSVNNILPDKNGNVQVEISGGGASSIGNFIGEVIIDNDETRIIEFTECADGSPLDFDELFITAQGGADTIRTLCFTTNNEYNSSAYNWSVQTNIGFNADKTSYGTAHCRMIGGHWVTLNYTNNTAVYATNVQRGYSAAVQQSKQRCVNSLVIGLGWGRFTNGTKISVYGR